MAVDTRSGLDAAMRALVSDVVAAELDARGFTVDAEPFGADKDDTAEEVEPLEGVDPYNLEPFADYVLREAGGGPLHTKDMAPRIYALGFKHRWTPKYRDQLVRSLNALASPSQHPEKYERVAPRTLRLKLGA